MQSVFSVNYFLAGSLFSYMVACARGGRGEERDSDDDDDEEDYDNDNDDGGTFFNTMWPLVMILIAGGILIAVILVFCRRCRHSLKHLHHRRASGSSSRNRSGTEADSGTGAVRDPSTDVADTMNDIWTVGGASLRDNFQPSSIHLEPPPYCESPPSYEELKLSFLETKGNPDIGANDLSIEERDTAEHPEENCPQATAPPDEDVVTMTTEYHQPPVVESSSETNQSLTAYDELTHTADVIDISEEMCNLYSNRDITCYVVNSSQGVDNLGFSVFK